MPNGFHGPENEWDRMEAPLVLIDSLLEAFADIHGLRLSRNYHNWPERSLVWNASEVRKLIQVFLEAEKELTFTVWICASADRGQKRSWKHKTLRKAVTIEEITPELEDILTQGKKILDSWNETVLEPVSG